MSASGMGSFNIADDTFIVADPTVLAELVADPGRMAAWWPDLHLTVTKDRGSLGRHWQVDGRWADVGWIGSMEMWLEPKLDGVVLHHYVRWDPVGRTLDQRTLARLAARYSTWWKQVAFSIKDEVDAGRTVGVGRFPHIQSR